MEQLLYYSNTAPGPQPLHEGSNFPTDSSPKQNIPPNAPGCILFSIAIASTFPHFSRTIMFCRRLSSSRMTDPMISQDGSWHYHRKRYHQVQEGHVQMYDMKLGNVAMFLSNPITERFDFPSANAGVCPGYTKAPVPNDMIYPSPSILYRFTWKSHPLPWLSLGVSYHCLKSS